MIALAPHRWLAAASLVFALLGTGIAPAGETGSAGTPFFVMDNGVGRGKWTPEEQARAVKELGYDGMSYNYTNRPELVGQWRAELEKRGLRLFGLFFYTYPDKPLAERYPPHLREAIAQLKGSDTFLWMGIRETKDKRKSGYDPVCVAMVRDVSDWARESGLKVALYPHAGCYIATAEESLRIVKQVNRPDVGMTVNLCHELMQKNAERLPQIVRDAAPHLFLASINGADRGGKPGGFIQRLDQGSYDVLDFLEMLRAGHYHGPIGLQCVGIKGDIRTNLQKSIDAWRKYRERLTTEAK